jgi:hypothetical protein
VRVGRRHQEKQRRCCAHHELEKLQLRLPF